MAGRPHEIARSMLDVPETDPRIREYLANGGINMDPETQAWCAQFVNASLAQAGLKGSGSGAARSFMNYGEPVLQPKQGDIAVFKRREDDPDPAAKSKGHAGFYEETDPFGRFNILGGNQGDAANIIPIEPDRLLGFRRPPGAPKEELPDMLAASVSPAKTDVVDYSRGINNLMDNAVPEMPIGGTETPTLTAAKNFGKNRPKPNQNDIASMLANAFQGGL